MSDETRIVEVTERGRRFFDLILAGVSMKEAEEIVDEELPKYTEVESEETKGGEMRKFRIEGVLKGQDYPHDEGRELSFIIEAVSKEEVNEQMKGYDWIWWRGEDLAETALLEKGE